MSRYTVLITDYAWPDLDIERSILKRIDANLVAAEQSDRDYLKEKIATSDAVMCNWIQIDRPLLEAATRLKIIARLGIGIDSVDTSFCREKNILVGNNPDYCVTEVAEHALAQILSIGRKIAFWHYETMHGRYQIQSGPQMWRMENQTVGIYGFGNTGIALAKKVLGIGMNVIAYSQSRRNNLHGVTFVDREELFRQSDYVSLHVPLLPQNQNLIGYDELCLMKPTASLINTARGGLVDHAALAKALSEDKIAGAALDVQVPEPPELNSAPYNDHRVLLTPHAAFISEESLIDLRKKAAEQIVDCLSGRQPQNIVNGVTVEKTSRQTTQP
ncbi:MAG: C-terminal binding protein [Pirellulaceae bacterium]|nr:C-terminal binding protein [Pirellulaceae bacterium]